MDLTVELRNSIREKLHEMIPVEFSGEAGVEAEVGKAYDKGIINAL